MSDKLNPSSFSSFACYTFYSFSFYLGTKSSAASIAISTAGIPSASAYSILSFFSFFCFPNTFSRIGFGWGKSSVSQKHHLVKASFLLLSPYIFHYLSKTFSKRLYLGSFSMIVCRKSINSRARGLNPVIERHAINLLSLKWLWVYLRRASSMRSSLIFLSSPSSVNSIPKKSRKISMEVSIFNPKY